MLIWGAMAVPVLTAIVLLVGFKHRVVWWEFLIPFGFSLIMVVGMKACVQTVQTRDTEYWGGVMQTAEYYERWNEKVTCRHTKYCTRTVRDGKGKSHSESYACGKQHGYDVDDHPPYWQVVDDNGIAIPISVGRFEQLARRFGNRRFVDLHRHYHTVDGDKYVATWDGSEATLEPVFTEHAYENRVQASNSVFNFQPVSKADVSAYQLFDYPPVDGYTQVSILGQGGPTQAAAEELLAKANARLGHGKQARIFVLIFRNQPQQAGILQENYWKRGNKNELVLTIGVNDNDDVQWGYVFSWTEVEELKIELRDQIASMKHLDLVKLVNDAVPLVTDKWQRKHFKDFSYLTVEPPIWAVALSYLLALLLNVGLSAWIVGNQFQDEPVRGWRGHRN